MRKLLYTMLAFAAVALTSCDKEEPGGTATQDMAGQWYVTVDAVDDAGEVVLEDPFGLGNILTLSFNTAENVATKMWMTDNGQFWDYQVVVNCNPGALTFSTDGWVESIAYEDSEVMITDGKIVPNGAVTPSGQPADYISYYIQFNDDPYPAAYGYTKYHVSGYRYTGFEADN